MHVQESFIDVSKVWLNELQQYANDKVVRVLAANKCDLTDQRKVSTADGQVRSLTCFGFDEARHCQFDTTTLISMFSEIRSMHGRIDVRDRVDVGPLTR